MKRSTTDGHHDNEANSTAKKTVIGEDDAQLYDRQIRLWGAASQQRLSESNVLVVGMNGTGMGVGFVVLGCNC
jgi:tRNA A37 threonylcarbamoyladenosine dehydratase